MTQATAPASHRPFLIAREIAARQQGLITTAQLREAGLSEAAIRHRTRTGLLKRLHRTVFRLGITPEPLEGCRLALLVCAPDAVLSHDTAATLRGLREGGIDRPHVIIPSGHRGRAAPAHVHRQQLHADEWSLLNGMPVTTSARTLLDLSATWPIGALELALSAGERAEPQLIGRLHELIGRHPLARGRARLRRLIRALRRLTRSEAERRFLEIVRQAGLPLPETNVLVLGYEVDNFWRAHRLIAEVDGYSVHGARRAFEADRRRDAALASAGFTVLRITYPRILNRPLEVAALVAQALRGAVE
jgi:very-short-patch-repair endonuclease